MKSACKIVLAVVMLFILTASAFALPQTAISIEYSAGKTQFDFYRLADFSEQSGLSLTDEFSKYTDKMQIGY